MIVQFLSWRLVIGRYRIVDKHQVAEILYIIISNPLIVFGHSAVSCRQNKYSNIPKVNTIIDRQYSASDGSQIQASMCIISKAKRICIIKMVIDVSMVTYNKIRSRNNKLSVRVRLYSSIMVNPLVIKGNTRHTMIYNISVINDSIKYSICYPKGQ